MNEETRKIEFQIIKETLELMSDWYHSFKTVDYLLFDKQVKKIRLLYGDIKFEESVKVSKDFVSRIASGNQYEIVRVLVENGASVKNNAIYYACYNSSNDLLKFLIQNNGWVDYNALGVAVKNNNLKAVKMLLDYDDSICREKMSSLHYRIADSCNLEIIELLLAHNACIDDGILSSLCAKRKNDLKYNNSLKCLEFFLEKRIGDKLEAIKRLPIYNNIEAAKILIKYNSPISSVVLEHSEGELYDLLLDHAKKLKKTNPELLIKTKGFTVPGYGIHQPAREWPKGLEND